MRPLDFFKDFRIIGCENSEEIKETLLNTHPRNFMGTDLPVMVLSAEIEHETNRGNRIVSRKLFINNALIDRDDKESLFDFVEARTNAYSVMHKKSQLKNFKVLNVEVVCCGVLRVE